MKTRTVRVNLQIELYGIHYRLVIDRKATQANYRSIATNATYRELAFVIGMTKERH